MLVINTRAYADFRLAVNILRKLDCVFYNNTANIQANPCTAAYAFDLERNQCVVLQSYPMGQFSVTDFPSAIAISDHLLIDDSSALAVNF